jgi:hypothetical protein
VSGTGTQLRDLLDDAVGEPPRHIDLAAVRRRVHRRRWSESAAAVMAVALVAALSVTALARAPGPARLGSAAPVHAGEPAYYVQQIIPQNPPGVTWVRATASGKVTAAVHCPLRGARVPLGAIAPAGHGVFFAVCEQGVYLKQELYPNVAGARLYRFDVTASGRVTGFSQVKGGVLGRYSISDVAVTPGGAEAAVALYSPGTGSNTFDGLLVINTRTGAQAVWRTGASASGMVLADINNLSLTSNGRELAFTTQVRCPTGLAPHACQRGQQVRAVSPALAGGRLTSSTLVFRAAELPRASSGYVNDALLNPAGSAVNVAVIHTPDRGGTVVVVVQASVRTGRQLRVLYRVDTGNGMSYQFFSADPTGRYLMLDAGSSAESNNGWIYHGHLVPLTPYDGNSVFWQAW